MHTEPPICVNLNMCVLLYIFFLYLNQIKM